MSHTAGMDTSGLPVPDAIPSLEQLQENLVSNLVQEEKFRPNLDELPITIQDDEISIATRDKFAYILRCLKVMYDLSSDVFFMAINLMDSFLTKVKVPADQKYMACISVSAFYTAAVQQMQPLDANHVVSISQCRCTADDLKRMSDLIQKKLERAPGTRPITALTFLRLFNNMFDVVARQLQLGDLYASITNESELILRLEMVACDGKCASLRPSEVALILLCSYLDAAVNRLINVNTDATVNNISRNASIPPYQRLRDELMQFATELRKKCNISEESFCSTHGAVSAILSKYNAQEQTNKTHKQKLIWRLSSRTADVLRPSQNFISELPVIAEYVPSVPSPNKISRKSRKYRRRGKRCQSAASPVSF